MEVKEAVRKINEVYDEWILEYAGSEKTSDEMTNECEEIISLLQELEKYKRMFLQCKISYEEMQERLKKCEPYKKMWEDLENLTKYDKSEIYKDQMMFIKQKYFPRPVKKVITIEIEGENVGWVIESFKDDVKNINREYKNIKVNIKEEK